VNFIWPSALIGLLAIPLLIIGYVWLDQRRLVTTDPTRRLGLGSTSRNESGRRRHIPAGLFIAALSLLLVGFARPQTTIDVPQRRSTIVLALDTSTSMIADDLEPTRLDAAKSVATEFVADQPDGIDLAVVSFGERGNVTSRPTDDRVATLSAIDRLQPEGGTSLAQGLFAALSTLAREPIVIEDDQPPNVDFGGFGSALVIVLSDGEDTTEQDPTLLTELAARSGIRVITIGIGTEEGTVIETEDGFSLGTSLSPGPLIALADATNGQYLEASDSDGLAGAVDALERELQLVEEDLELTAILGIAALLLAALAGLFALAATGRMP